MRFRGLACFGFLAIGMTSCGPTHGAVDAGGQSADAPTPDAGNDADFDGIPDDVEGRRDPNGPVDTDGDGIPDYLDTDSDGDTLPDVDEGTGDLDGDGIPNWRDPTNDGPVPTITLTAISTAFNQPIGIDYHSPTDTVVMSVNYPTGTPLNIERIAFDGTHEPFSSMSGLTDEVKIGTVRPGNSGGFVPGDLFVGNGIDGQIVRVTDDGATVINPWVDLPGVSNGLMRGSFYADRTNVFGGDLIAVTTLGEVWRITSAGVPTLVASVGVHLEGAIVVPNAPARYGPLAGKIIAGAEGQGVLYAFQTDGTVQTFNVGVAIEDIEIISPGENFFGVNFGTSFLLGASVDDFVTVVGDILLTQETHTGVGLYLLRWRNGQLVAEEFGLDPGSATVGQWEHVTFAPSGIVEIPPVQ